MKSSKALPETFVWPLNLAAWGAVLFVTVFFNLLGILLFPFAWLLDRRTGFIMHKVAVLWARSMMVAMRGVWTLRVEGVENLKPQRPFIFVANHQSLLDILVVLSALPVHFKFVAKKELYSIPFLGWQMALARYIGIDRGNAESGREVMRQACGWLKRKVSVVFFPEGTRSLDGQIQPFKMGSFKLAEQEGLELVPLVIDGTGDTIPKHSWMIKNKACFVLSVGKPVSLKAREDLRPQVEAIGEEMMRRLAQVRKAL